MNVIKVTPRGYCYGVIDAIQLAKKVARDANVPRPIYILGLVVHNRHVVDQLSEEYGIISLDGLDRMALLESIPNDSTVIFTAHGVSPAVKERARQRGLTSFDATCPDVTRTHDLVQDLVSKGYHVVYIGKKGHPESEGVIGVAPSRVHLVESVEDAEKLALPQVPLAVTTQTTISQWDTEEIVNNIKVKWPDMEVYNEICFATQTRQEAVVEMAEQADVVIVVGDSRSNNSNRLVQVVLERTSTPAYLVDSAADLKPEWFKGATSVAVTSGSSTPTHLTREVITLLEGM